MAVPCVPAPNIAPPRAANRHIGLGDRAAAPRAGKLRSGQNHHRGICARFVNIKLRARSSGERESSPFHLMRRRGGLGLFFRRPEILELGKTREHHPQLSAHRIAAIGPLSVERCWWRFVGGSSRRRLIASHGQSLKAAPTAATARFSVSCHLCHSGRGRQCSAQGFGIQRLSAFSIGGRLLHGGNLQHWRPV